MNGSNERCACRQFRSSVTCGVSILTPLLFRHAPVPSALELSLSQFERFKNSTMLSDLTCADAETNMEFHAIVQRLGCCYATVVEVGETMQGTPSG
jgi:hypothetical protein